MSAVEELAEATRTVAERVAPSVVRVGRDGGRGCGVVVGPGQVVTNAHNLRGREITVAFADGRVEVGTVGGADIGRDLALVAVDTADAPAADWSEDPARLGDVVFSVTRTVGGGSRITAGQVSGTERAFRGPRGRRIAGSIEHTTPLVRGSSGSPVVDPAGRLLGLNTNRLGGGFYLALPADADLQRRIDLLSSGDARETLRLGIGLASADVARRLRASVGLPERDGLLVRVVEDDSPAAAAGLQQGDLLVAAGDQALATVDDLYDVLDTVEPGGTLTVGVVRGTDELDLTITFPASA
jgi:serine protease Do